jgi:hypothetical protein
VTGQRAARQDSARKDKEILMSIQTQLFIIGLALVLGLAWGIRSYDRMQERKKMNANLMRHCRKLEERDIRGRA